MIAGRVRRLLAGLTCGLLYLTASATAAADWLVTRDGTRVETRGAWEVKGRQVVFTLPNGTLSALRLDEVDLEASASATAEARKPPPAPEPAAERQPVMVLTNDDIRTVPAGGGGAAGDESSAGDEGTASVSADSGAADDSGDGDDDGDVELQLLTWKAQPSDKVGGLEIVGTVRNVGTDPAAKVEVAVTIPGEGGETLFETTAFVRSAVLAPGRHTNFRALLPNIYQLTADPVFEIRSTSYSLGGRAPATNR